MKIGRLEIFALLIVIPFLMNCGEAPSEGDVKKILAEGFTNNGFVQSKIEVKNTTGIKGLIDEGYLAATPEGSFTYEGTTYTSYKFGATLKGKQYSNKEGLFPNGSIGSHSFWGTSATFVGAVRKQSLKKINEIKYDDKTKIATVSYVVGYEPAEPYYTAVCPGNESAECNYSQTEVKTIALKKSDTGWSILSAAQDKPSPSKSSDSTVAAKVPEPTAPVAASIPAQQMTFSPSFDCAKASSGPERLICSNKDLSEADVKLAQIFRNALSKSKNKASLKREQAQWIKNNRDACSDSTAMLKAYQDRIAELSGK